ncbi:MAG: FAD-binding oxidoreductase [Fibrella sp.]|nr:FAD-binding oxidoreductase [Armatimonadota bacterium]
MSPLHNNSLFAELVKRFGDDSVRRPDGSGAETFTGWYPVAVKQRQAGEETPTLLAIVSPANTREVGDLFHWGDTQSVSVVPVGGGSNTVGSTLPETGRATVAVTLSRLDSIAWDETSLCVTAGAGVLLSDLEDTLNRHQYTLGSLPQSARIATVGGAVATEAFGLLAAGYGGIRENTLALEAVLPGGEIIRTSANSAATRTVHHLLIGTEGAFGTITAATLTIRPVPEVRAWCAFAFGTVADAFDALRLVYRSDARPTGVRFLDAPATRERFADTVPDGNSLLLLGVEGSEIVQTGQYQTLFAVCKQVGGAEVGIDGDAWYESERFRTDAFAANGRPGSVADILSVFAPWSTLNAVYRALTDALRPDVSGLSAQIGYATPHGAALDVRFVAETPAPRDALSRHERILQNAQEIALTHGANVAHHYGIGIARRAWANAERGAAQTEALRRLSAR